jgi:hypothetical protein
VLAHENPCTVRAGREHHDLAAAVRGYDVYEHIVPFVDGNALGEK